MVSWFKRQKKTALGRPNTHYNNNRINLVIAIVFLLGASTLYRLYDLQINKHDLYSAMASNQHQISSELSPSRGNIFFKSKDNNLYPLAANKEFALLYTVPVDVRQAPDLAEKLYMVFDKVKVAEEVDELLDDAKKIRLQKELDYIASLALSAEDKAVKETEARRNLEVLNKEEREIEIIKREAEIELRHEKIIAGYLKILTKRNDPYEPLKKKVPEETLLELYAEFLSDDRVRVAATDLKLKDGQVFKKEGRSELSLVNIVGIGFTMEFHRVYPEGNIGAHALGFTNLIDEKLRGQYGLEGFFDEELFGQYGSVKTERGASKNIMILNDREYIQAIDGDDFYLTIDRSVQFTVCQKLNETALRHGADGGSVIIMNPATGAILAMCSWPDFDPNNYQEVEDIKVYNNPVVFSQYEPGSVFKTITMAAALDLEKITPETTYNDEGKVMVAGWPKPIKNSDYDQKGGHGEVNMNTVLEESLNTGAIFAMEQVGKNSFADYVKNFGFGEISGIELSAENAGDISNLSGKRITEVNAAVASFGQGITVTPLQMLNSYAAVANGGILMKPYMVEKVVHDNGAEEIIQPRQIRQVISERTATLLSGMLVNVVESGHAKLAAVDGYYVAGKTGTAQVASSAKQGYSDRTIHTFIGFAPVEEPKFVMLVKLDDPKGIDFAASSAAPLFGEIAEFLLNYYQVPKERR